MDRLVIDDLSSIDQVAKKFLDATEGVRLFAFNGQMGAGKTTFICALCRVLGVDDEVSSPTFTIVNEYVASAGREICHFDFYRIESLAEAMDIGLEEYLYSDKICFMEWSENVEQLLPPETLKVDITITADGVRELSF